MRNREREKKKKKKKESGRIRDHHPSNAIFLMIKQPFIKPGTPCNARYWCYNAGKLSAGKPLCESSTTPPRSPVYGPTESSFIASCARAAWAPMAVTMASTRLQGRAPSEPGFEIQREVPLFSSQFHHFWTLSATDDHLDCFNQTFFCPFMQKYLGPLESGTESKKKRLFGLA